MTKIKIILDNLIKYLSNNVKLIKKLIKQVLINYKSTTWGVIVVLFACYFGYKGQTELAIAFLTAGIGLLSAKDFDKK